MSALHLLWIVPVATLGGFILCALLVGGGRSKAIIRQLLKALKEYVRVDPCDQPGAPEDETYKQAMDALCDAEEYLE